MSHQSNVVLMELDFVVHSCEYYEFLWNKGTPLISIKTMIKIAGYSANLAAL